MDIARIFRHFAMPPWRVRHVFPPSALSAIEDAIRTGEALHRGQVRFVVEGALGTSALLHAQSAHERAIDVFSLLRVWDTEHNSGVLIYVLLADRSVHIVADRGIHATVGPREWKRICLAMELAFRRGLYAQGVLDGIQSVHRCLAAHFPARRGLQRDELPDAPVLM